MSRNRAHTRNKPRLVKEPGANGSNGHSATALADRPVLIPLDEEIRPILQEARGKRAARQANSPLKAFSLAWDETEAMGITADMRRSGPGMLSDADRKDTLYQAYLNSVWISACVDVIAKRITSGGLTIDLAENGKENQAEYDELHEFLHYINEDEDFLHLIRGIVTDLLIYGEAYMEIVSKSGKPFSLHKIDCCTMNYKLDRHGTVTGYVQNMVHSTETVPFEPEEVIRWWLADPKANKKALSPIERILGPIDADVHMADWVRAFFRKGARPPFWIKYPGSMEEAKRFVAWLRETYTGQANAHVPMVLYDEAELYEIGKGSVDIDFLKGRESARTEILAGYQVPPAIVGVIESGNIGGGTGESQEKGFLHNACDPVRELVFELFNYRIVKKGFGITNYRVNTRYADFRTDETISKVNDTAIRNGSNTVNEVRIAQGKPEVDGGDEAVIVASRDIVPVARLQQLGDEQAATAQAALDTAKANADMAATKAKQAKEPPAPVPVALQNAQAGPQGANQPGKPVQANNQQQKAPPDPGAQESYIRDLHQASARINEALARADEHLRVIRAQDVTHHEDHPPQEHDWATLEDEIRRILTPYKVEFQESQQHTGVMVAFMIAPDVAHQIAIPGGEPVQDLHLTLAFLGDLEDSGSDLSARLPALKQALAPFAAHSTPLRGKVAGLGRFGAPDGELTPVIALPDVPGLSEFRQALVGLLASQGCPANAEHGYQPHITLAYIDADKPMPITSVPALPLALDTLCLAVGDDRYYYKLGGEDKPDDSEENQPPTPTPGAESHTVQHARTDAQEGSGAPEPLPGPAESATPGEQRNELAQWRGRALEDVETQVWRGFTTTIIPESLHTAISQSLQNCSTQADVQFVFESAQQGRLSKVALKHRIHELLSSVADRGHKALGEESEE